MAVLTTDEWYEIDFYGLGNAAWTGLSTFPQMPPAFMDSMVNGTKVVVYCADATGIPNQLLVEGGGSVYINPAVINTATLLTKANAVDEVTTAFKGAQESTGTRRFIMTGGFVYSFDSTEAGLLSTILAP